MKGKKHLLVVCAVEEEAKHLRKLLGDYSVTRSLDHLPFSQLVNCTESQLPNLKVTLFVCNIGLVNASIFLTSFLLLDSSVDWVINYGCAGSHSRKIDVGDICLPEAVTLHHACIYDRNNNLVPEGFRMTMDPRSSFQQHYCDAKLLQIAAAVGESDLQFVRVNVQCTPNELKFEEPRSAQGGNSRIFVGGLVGSSDMWTQSEDGIKEISRLNNTVCEDMESGSLIHVCKLFEVPFLVVRDISNNELINTSRMFEGPGMFLEQDKMGAAAAQLTYQIIQKLNQ
eukprot:GCRY01004989.1.p1 GENE.GCRY01004989.1~~GCRY01004989.1.p1  ORF type:complete len:283 (-),score=13.35 GCRY01004989.1:29-877(-)